MTAPYSHADVIKFLGAQVDGLTFADCCGGYLKTSHHHRPPSRPSFDSLTARVRFATWPRLGRTQSQRIQCLLTLHQQIGKQHGKCISGDLIRRLPVVQRAPIGRGRLLHHQRPSEGRLEQFGYLRSHLLEADALGIGRLPAVAMSRRVCRTPNTDRTVRVDRSRQISRCI